jgi:hypothetical protein
VKKIRKPAVAGYFYPHDPTELRSQIDSLLNNNKPDKLIEKISGIIAPHAGYQYSGKAAAYVYNQLIGKNYKTVVVISPSHREYFPGNCIYSGDAYETPLGLIEIDKEISNKLADSKIIFKGAQGHRQEHALEVHLPFLQIVLSDFKIVPIVMGEQNKVFVDALSEKLAEIISDDVLIVASSDLSHFYPREEADRLDKIIEEMINNFNYDGLLLAVDQKKCEACGAGPIVAMMKACSLAGKTKSKVLFRNDSGDVSGEFREVVGYLSAVIYG